MTQHWWECTAGTQRRDATLDACLSFLQIEGKGVKLFKEELAVILPCMVCFHRRKIFPDSAKVLAAKAAGKMNEDERGAGSILSALSIFEGYFRLTEKELVAVISLSNYLISLSPTKHVTVPPALVQQGNLPEIWAFFHKNNTKNPTLSASPDVQ